MNPRLRFMETTGRELELEAERISLELKKDNGIHDEEMLEVHDISKGFRDPHIVELLWKWMTPG